MSQPNVQPEPTRHDWMITASGKRLFILDPNPELITIEDMAHSLSNICRFGGHVGEFYSVAQHSVLVSELVPREWAPAGLLHDGMEYVLGDVIRPVKRVIGVSYTRLELAWWLAIAQRFGVNPLLPECVKHADLIALQTERRDLLPAHTYQWLKEDGALYTPHPRTIAPMTPREARAAFIARFEELF